MEDILKKHNLSLIMMHGSQVTGKTHDKSDIDIAVMPKKNRDFKLGLYGDLSKYFKFDNVDIVNLKTANPLLAFCVARKSKLLAGKKTDYDAFVKLAFHKYSDYQPYLKMEADFVKERINALCH